MVFCAFRNPRHGALLETLSCKLIKITLGSSYFRRVWLNHFTGKHSVVPELHPGEPDFSLPHKPGVTPPKQMESQGCETEVSKQKTQPIVCIICSFKAIFAMRSFHEKESGGEIVSLALRIPSFGDFREFAEEKLMSATTGRSWILPLPCVFACIILHNSCSDAQCCHLPLWLPVCSSQLGESEDVLLPSGGKEAHPLCTLGAGTFRRYIPLCQAWWSIND